MNAFRLPWITDMDLPDAGCWAMCPGYEAERRLDSFKAQQSRPWHTPSLAIYEATGAEQCYVAYTWQPTRQELDDLRRFFNG